MIISTLYTKIEKSIPGVKEIKRLTEEIQQDVSSNPSGEDLGGVIFWLES